MREDAISSLAFSSHVLSKCYWCVFSLGHLAHMARNRDFFSPQMTHRVIFPTLFPAKTPQSFWKRSWPPPPGASSRVLANALVPGGVAPMLLLIQGVRRAGQAGDGR